jgi:DNA-binding MarR family transcriptional regulator
MVDDVSVASLWRPLRLLMQRMDDEIARVYEEMPGAEGLRPSWVFEILRLDAQGPMTIRQLADSVGRTHSALSQKVAAMGRAGLVETRVGRDGRMRQVHLTDRARALVGRMRAEWQATEQVLAELEAETPYPLSQTVRDLEAALERKSFYSRLSERLDSNGRDQGGQDHGNS